MVTSGSPAPAKILDDTDWRIVRLLQSNARLSYREIGRRINLSTPAVTERVRKLEEAHVIQGYRAMLNPTALGRSVTAFMQFTVPKRDTPQAVAYLRTVPEVLECHHVTGHTSYLVKLQIASIERLDALMQDFGRYGETQTMIVLSSPILDQMID